MEDPIWYALNPFECLNLSLTRHLEYERIAQRIAEGEARRSKQQSLWQLLARKVRSVAYPMQELEFTYPTTKGKTYSEEEDRYLVCRLHNYGPVDDVYERIKKDISEFPMFRFDWFFKSRTPQELQRRCTTLLSLIEKEYETEEQTKVTKGPGRGKKRAAVEDTASVASASKRGSRAASPPVAKAKKTKA